MTISKSHFYLAGIIAGGIILGAIIFRGCDRSPSHKDDAREVKALQDKLQQVEQEKEADSARLTKRSDSLQLVNHDLKNKKEVVEKELASLRKDRKRLSDKLDTARANKDTAGYISACDSLQERTKLQDEVIGMYVAYVDSVEANHEAQLAVKDSLIKNRQDLIVQLRATNQVTYEKYETLITDYGKATRKLKRERTLSRILAITTAISGGFILLKK